MLMCVSAYTLYACLHMYCMYVCMEEAWSWTNIPSCLSFLRYVLCKHYGLGHKLHSWDIRLFPPLFSLNILYKYYQPGVSAIFAL